MLKCVVRTCILNPSPPEDLVQKYIGQKRLTHLALMTTNCDILKNLNRAKLMKEFVDRTPERRCVFGFIVTLTDIMKLPLTEQTDG